MLLALSRDIKVPPALCTFCCDQCCRGSDRDQSSGAGVEVGLRFDYAVKRVHHRVWKKYGNMEISAAKLRARKIHTKAVSRHIQTQLASVGKLVNQKEHEIEKQKKVDDEISVLKENINAGADDMNQGSARIAEGARKAEARASKMLDPSYREELSKEAVAAADMKKITRQAAKSVLDAARTASDESNVELLANIAEQAEKQTRHYVHASEEKAAEMKKTAAKAELKLKRAVDKKKLSVEKDIAKDEKTAVKLNMLTAKSQHAEKRAVKAEQKTRKAAATGKIAATKALETARATKSLAVWKETPQLKKAKKAEKGGKTGKLAKKDVGEEAKSGAKKNKSIAAKSEAKAEAKAKKAAKVEKKAEEAYRSQVKNLKKAKRMAKRQAKLAKKVAGKTVRARERLAEKLDRDKFKLNSLSSLTEQFRSKSITPNNAEPLTKEKDQLRKDEAYVDKVKVEAKAVKKRARRHIKNQLARKITQNLLLQKKVSKLKSKLEGEQVLLKAEKKKEAPPSEREALARAQIDRDAAKKEMKIAEKEQRAVVDKEKLAATTIIANMKMEIKRQATAQKKKDGDRDGLAKKMLADARALLIRAKAVSGTSLKSEGKKAKREASAAKKDVKLAKMSIKDLIGMVKNQYRSAKAKVDEDAKVADSGANKERAKQIIAKAKIDGVDKKLMKNIKKAKVKKTKAAKRIVKKKKKKAKAAKKAAKEKKKAKAEQKQVEAKAATRAEKQEKKANKKAKKDAKKAAEKPTKKQTKKSIKKMVEKKAAAKKAKRKATKKEAKKRFTKKVASIKSKAVRSATKSSGKSVVKVNKKGDAKKKASDSKKASRL